MIVSFLCLGWWAFALTAGMTRLPPTSDIQLSASTNSIQEGFTKSLTVTCSFLHHQGSDVSVVTSLILSKTASVEGTRYTDIATITVANPDSVEVKDDLGAKVTGKLALVGSSSIVYEWTYPDQTTEGKYQCTAHGLNSAGHPMITSAGTVIQKQSVNLQMILEKVQSLESQQNVLTRLLSNTSAQLNETTTELWKKTTELNTMKLDLNSTKSELDQTKNKLQSLEIKTTTQLANATAELNTMKLDLNSAKSELDQTKNKLQSLESNQINTMKQDITELRHNQDTKVMFTASYRFTHVAVSGGHVVIFSDLVMSVGGGYDTTTGVFTAPVSGYYMATVNVLSHTDEQVQVYIQHNNNNVVSAIADDNLDHQAASSSAALHLHKGDTVRPFSSRTPELDHTSTFSVFLVSL